MSTTKMPRNRRAFSLLAVTCILQLIGTSPSGASIHGHTASSLHSTKIQAIGNRTFSNALDVNWSEFPGSVFSLNPPDFVDGVDSETVTNVSVLLIWDEPESYGFPITNYEVRKSTNGRSWTAVTHKASSNATLLVTGLTGGTEYQFKVRAITSQGKGQYSDIFTVSTIDVTPSLEIDADTVLTDEDITFTVSSNVDEGSNIPGVGKLQMKSCPSNNGVLENFEDASEYDVAWTSPSKPGKCKATYTFTPDGGKAISKSLTINVEKYKMSYAEVEWDFSDYTDIGVTVVIYGNDDEVWDVAVKVQLQYKSWSKGTWRTLETEYAEGEDGAYLSQYPGFGYYRVNVSALGYKNESGFW